MRCRKALEYERDIELLKSELAHERADNLELMIALSEKEAIVAESDTRLAQAKEAYDEHMNAVVYVLNQMIAAMPPMGCKAVYEMVAPAIDSDGNVLFQEALALTGKTTYDLEREFYYENCKGLFEIANGKTKLRYLNNMCYGTVVEYEIMGWYEHPVKTIIHDTAEWRAYQESLYAATLAKLGIRIKVM